MALIVKALETQKYSTHIADEVKEKNAHEYELYARDIVTHLHQKALKGKSAEGFRLAAAAYRNYLDFFDASEAYDEMAMNYAETLFSAEDYLEAGKQFETLAGSRVRSERERRDGLYSAVLSYYLALKNTEDLSAYEKVYARSGLRAVGKTYTAEYPRADKVPNVLFNVAWVAYNEGKYGVAIDEFSRFVTAYPQSAEAKAAVHLILDAYNLTEDYEGLVAFGRGVLKNGALDRDLKAEVAGIVQASESKVLNPLALAAVENWDQGKKGLIAFAEKHQSSSLGEQALQAVVASSSELRDLPTLFGAADDLLRKYPQSSKVEETLNLVIETCLNASQFRRLAASLEEFARRLPRHASSADFLYQAAQIRQGLGQYRLANADYAQLLAGTSAKYRDKVEIVWTLVENNLKLGDDRGALRLLLEREGKLQGTSRTRAQATIAELYRQGGDGQGAAKFRKAARIGFEKNGGDQDPAMKDALAGMEFGFLAGQYRDYMDLQLGGSIDDAIVRRKGDLLGSLLKGYHKVMKLQSPEYALAACNRACEVNHEFARFLRGAPLPELTPEQQEQYAGIVAEKAAGYEEKGDDYLQNAIEMARKWEICDADLAAYFRRNGGGGQAAAPTVETGPEWLADPGLKGLHLQALEKPGDPGRLQALAVRYLKRGDYRHAILIAQRALEGAGDDDPAGKASLYNTLGVAYLYCNEDQIAKDAFHKAIACQADHRAARVNLAGIYQYYEHMGKARTIYMDLGVSMPSAPNDELIHPRSREYYHAFNRFAQQ
ncbi:MAG: hypothetical protein C0617_11510 [Desulfuromonas sp.]|uniref:tetratricopeptide repeat protein n=1 Tax=Desulfuromonas sp. TaxID=892 RepID=UPI000CC721B8|nr:hypothetical protein [Desulfuromonas sp.]PLX83160.1 MAG: hypothetical protein C0617_11510 [Desulfuromonas sp.]